MEERIDAPPPDAGLRHAIAAAQACLTLVAAGQAGRLVHFSTFHVYGKPGRTRYEETDTLAPTHPYGRIHLAVEQHLLAAAADADIVIARPTNLVGTPAHADLGDQSKLLFIDLCRQAARGGVSLRNDGRGHRDFLPFGDAIDAVRRLLGTGSAAGPVVNIAAGQSQSIADLAGTIAAACPKHVHVSFGAGDDPYREPFTVTTDRLQRTGWRPEAWIAAEAALCVAFFS